jgi:hypothetical protein
MDMLLFAVLILASLFAGPARGQGGVPHPGLLETFLASTHDPPISEKQLGSLSGPNKATATFRAIVAKDPANSRHTVKGLEVVLTANNKSVTLYLDDDRDPDSTIGSLEQFQILLSRLPTHLETRPKMTVGVLNRPGSSPTYCCPRFDAMNAGIYRRGEESGVVIDSGGNPVIIEALFPGQKLNSVVEMIAAGRAWLDSN